MAKPEFNEGAEAQKKFDDGMRKLFQKPKSVVKKNPVSKPKRKKTSKD